jgi:hypothetical protein
VLDTNWGKPSIRRNGNVTTTPKQTLDKGAWERCMSTISNGTREAAHELKAAPELKDPPELKGLFDAFYRHFVLRDLFGKIVPGFIVMTALAAILLDPVTLKSSVSNFSWPIWITAVAAGWITGFAIQSFGELFKLILYFPTDAWSWSCSFFKLRLSGHQTWSVTLGSLKKIDTKGATELREVRDLLSRTEFQSYQEFYQFFIPVQRELDAQDAPRAAIVERLAVIKEACGNGYLALLIASVVLLVRYIITNGGNPAQLGFGVLTLFLAAVFLGRMHFEHVKRQHLYSVEAIRLNHWFDKA